MMSKTIQTILCLGILTQSLAFASAVSPRENTYQYRVRIPATSLSCDQEAALLAQRFEASTHLAAIQKSCVGEVNVSFDGASVKLYSLMLSYSAPEALQAYSAALGGISDSYSPFVESAAYKTYSECVSAIHSQNTSFAHATDLMPVATQCLPSRFGAEAGYVMTIDGFGTPAKRLQIFHPIFGTDDAALSAEVQAFVVSHGGDIVRAQGNAILFYSAGSAWVRQGSFGLFHDLSQCQAQVDSVSAIFSASGSQSPAIVRCPQDIYAGASYALDGMADGYSFLMHSQAQEKYFTFDECMQDRARMIQTPHNGYAVDGAICMDDQFANHQFVMELFYH